MQKYLSSAVLLLITGFSLAGTRVDAAEPTSVTFASDIAAIIHEKCTICHRNGQPGPFPLISFTDVRDRAQTIQAVVHDRYMPPWKPVNDEVQFANDRRLSYEEQSLLDKWIEAGLPAGDLESLQYPEFKSGWSLGEPDLVLKMNERFEVPASGPDVYRSFVLPAGLPEDKWVKAIELRPSARGAVHHALFFIDTSGASRKQDGLDGKPGFSGMSFLRDSLRGNAEAARGLGGYVPGAMPNKLPGDLAMFLPKGGDIIMQTHFHPSGRSEWEQAELALYFADKPPSQKLVSIQLPPLFGRLAGLDIPAGQKVFEISESITLPVDVEAVGISGHAHYICREMLMTATLPDGKVVDLLKIDDWDLDWQDQYQFKQLMPLPAGTRLDARITYDNSADNPENPNSPPKRIQWGRESTDEMGSLTLQVVAKENNDRPELVRATQSLIAQSMKSQAGKRPMAGALERLRGEIGKRMLDDRVIRSLDKNSDGKLQKSEVPKRLQERVFQFGDKNGDEVIDADELKELQQLVKDNQR